MYTPTRTAAELAAAMATAGADIGFAVAGSEEALEALWLAGDLMNCAVAPPHVVRRVLGLQPAAALVRREAGKIAGVVSTLLLRTSARTDLLAGRFDGLSPSLASLCEPGDEAALYYIWGVAGRSRSARWSAMELSRRLRMTVLADLEAFTRAATADGRRAGVARLGFQPAFGPGDSLLISPPVVERNAA